MTTIGMFDPFEQRIAAAIDEIATPTRPAYLDDILRQTARTSQRPRWTFPGRWLPADTWPVAMPAPVSGRLVVLLLLALLLLAIGAAVAGSLTRGPLPFGPAGNGLIGYPANGDLYVRDTITSQPRLLVGGPDAEMGPWFSPDGRRILFTRVSGGREYAWAANADGSNPHQVAAEPMVNANAVWAPDSRTIAVVNDVRGVPVLSLVDTETGSSRPIDLGDLQPLPDLAFRPPDGAELLVRVGIGVHAVDVAIVPMDGGPPRVLGLRGEWLMGQQWETGGPVWSPDGQRIAYNRVERDPATGYVHFRVHTVRADGTDDVAIPGPAQDTIHEAWPAYSPDGRWILVHRWTWKGQGGGAGWLAVLPADGSAPARNIGPRVPGGEDTGLVKVWSPDGTRVLLRAQNTRQVFSIDPATNRVEQLPWSDDLPDWQRVNRWP
jgi:WD40-like Beta Propeller Repeat